MPNLKIVLVGPGLIGKQHLRLLRENSEVDLMAIVAPEDEENLRISATNRVPLFGRLEDCLKSFSPDGVIIASPNAFHFQQACVCIKFNVPVLIEKPITATLDEGKALVELAHKYNSKVLIGHHRAHSPLMKSARDLIHSGRLGRLVAIIGSAQFHKPTQYFLDGPWRTKPGGGPILINLIHEVGNLRSLIGEVDAVQAFSSSGIRGHEVEDTVSINFRFKNGVLGTFMLSDTAATPWSWEQTSQENPSYPSYSDSECYSVSGTRGSLSIPSMRLKYHPEPVEPSWWTPFEEETITVSRQDPLACQLAHFVKVIKGESLPLVSERDGYQNLLITEAVRESANTNSIVYIRS